MTFYCPKCYKKTEYTLKKPEICPHCSTVSASMFVAAPVVATVAAVPARTVPRRPAPPKRTPTRLRPDVDDVEASEEEEFEEDGMEEEEYDPSYRSGKFNQFFDADRAKLENLGVSVERDIVKGVTLAQLFPNDKRESEQGS